MMYQYIWEQADVLAHMRVGEYCELQEWTFRYGLTTSGGPYGEKTMAGQSTDRQKSQGAAVRGRVIGSLYPHIK